MTDDTSPPSEPLADSIRAALDAATLANEAAQDLDNQRSGARAFADAMVLKQRRMTALAATIAAVAAVSLGFSALVYFRSVADLREAGTLQADALTVLVARVTTLGETIAHAEATQAEIVAQATEVTSEFLALSATLTEQTNKLAESALMETQIASAITARLDAGFEASKVDMQTAIADLNLSLSQLIAGATTGGGMDALDLTAALGDLRAGQTAIMARLATAPAAGAAPVVAARAARTNRPAPRPQAPALPNPIQFP